LEYAETKILLKDQSSN